MYLIHKKQKLIIIWEAHESEVLVVLLSDKINKNHNQIFWSKIHLCKFCLKNGDAKFVNLQIQLLTKMIKKKKKLKIVRRLLSKSARDVANQNKSSSNKLLFKQAKFVWNPKNQPSSNNVNKTYLNYKNPQYNKPKK